MKGTVILSLSLVTICTLSDIAEAQRRRCSSRASSPSSRTAAFRPIASTAAGFISPLAANNSLYRTNTAILASQYQAVQLARLQAYQQAAYNNASGESAAVKSEALERRRGRLREQNVNEIVAAGEKAEAADRLGRAMSCYRRVIRTAPHSEQASVARAALTRIDSQRS